jgi:release factor glutamine methyltransferase
LQQLNGLAEPAAGLTWQEATEALRADLDRAAVDNAEQLATWVVQEASGLDGAEWLLDRQNGATVGGMKRIDRLRERLVEGEPIQYVLGHWPFRSLDLMVDRRVLIPRPETEALVDVALAQLDRILADSSQAAPLSDTIVLLTDVSSDALAVARANLAGNGRSAARVRIAHGDWFEALDHLMSDEPPMIAHFERPNLVVANPPYIAYGDTVDASVFEWEPHLALYSDGDGLDAVYAVIDGAGDRLADGGALVMEIGASQAAAVLERARRWSAEPRVEPDLAGLDRYLVAVKP